MRAGEIIAARRDEIARLITLESGLCLKDTQYEVGRASDVLLFAANQALVDDGQVFSCDLTAHGKSRKVYTLQRAAAGRDHRDHPVQPSAQPGDPQGRACRRDEQPRWSSSRAKRRRWRPILIADILYEAGLPPQMLSVITGDPARNRR